MTMQEVKQEIARLESTKNGDLMHDLEVQDEIMELEVKFLGKSKPEHTVVDCIGCGS